MFQSLLIANRGEIALRIARTAEALGIDWVAVHAEDEDDPAHIQGAGAVACLPGRGAAAYLDADALIAVALEEGCDAVHPGYGFLSESAEFAEGCRAAGLVFVGPDPDTLRRLGDKLAARALAQSVGVPVIAGSGPLASAAALTAFMHSAGNRPLLLKALAGGGGRGMRRVTSSEQAEAAFAAAGAEARAAFGNDGLYAESLLENVRHIEVQIVGDGREVTHLWERDCSLQRRHQKLIELAPAPDLDDDLRAALLDGAVALGRACGYRGLGTVEFLVSTAGEGDFHFIEVNPRLQVEHTVTEAVTGLDLVALQLKIADGASLADLGLADGPQVPGGMAVQLRINAETYGPSGEARPAGGALTAFAPPVGPGLRTDTHGRVGDAPHPGFDSLLAKLVVHDPSGGLPEVLGRACAALAAFDIAGVAINAALLGDLLTDPALAEWAVDTRFVDRLLARATAAPAAMPPGAVTAPMLAQVHSVAVAPGDTFAAGQEIAVLEAMKMQHGIVAPAAGCVLEVAARPGQVVNAGDLLLTFDATGDSAHSEARSTGPDPDHIRPDLAALNERLALTRDDARPEAIARRRGRGQRTARENVADLCRGGRFHEFGALVHAAQRRRRPVEELRAKTPADGIIAGLGEVNAGLVSAEAAQVAVLSYDGSVLAGTQGFLGHLKTDRFFDVAMRNRLPVIFFTEGGGGRPGDVDFDAIKRAGLDVMTFHNFARMRGRGPKICVNSGYCFAGNAAVFGAGDIRIATRNSWIGLGGPAMIEAGGLGTVKPTDIGPASMQAEIGLVDVLCEDEAEATKAARSAMSYFQGPLADWQAEDSRALRHLIPEDRLRAYDIRAVITTLADIGGLLELGGDHAPGLVAGLIRIEGRPMGLIANNPGHLGGALDAAASAKAARYLRLFGKFALPVLSLCDTPGFMVGPESEAQGGVGAACDFLTAGAELPVPLFFLCLRKGYGIGAQAMAGGSFATPDFTVSWPTGEFGPMGLEGAVTLGFKRELEAEPNEDRRRDLFDRLVAQSYAEGGALNIASLGEIDAVIDPAETRAWIVRGLDIQPPGGRSR